MLLVGNVVVNRVAAQCDVFRDVTSITEAVYQKNAFAGVESPLFQGPANAKEKRVSSKKLLNTIDVLQQHMHYGLKTQGQTLFVLKNFTGYLAGRFKSHCFYDPGEELRCDF